MLALAACGGGRQAKLQGLCTGMLEGDPKASRQQARNFDAKSFCECYARTATADGENVLKLHTDIWSALSHISQREETSDLETAAEILEEELRFGLGEHPFDEDAISLVDDYFYSIATQFGETGACALRSAAPIKG